MSIVGSIKFTKPTIVEEGGGGGGPKFYTKKHLQKFQHLQHIFIVKTPN
jgi:hypothetical protein